MIKSLVLKMIKIFQNFEGLEKKEVLAAKRVDAIPLRTDVPDGSCCQKEKEKSENKNNLHLEYDVDNGVYSTYLEEYQNKNIKCNQIQN